jgi:GDP-L-fucose synthase
MLTYNDTGHVNVGTGEDVSIKELAETIKNVVGYSGEIMYDTNRPDGTPRKLLDVSKIHSLGWKHTLSLTDGIRTTYKHYLEELSSGKLREI